MASRAQLWASGVAGSVLSRLFFGVARRWQDPERERAFRSLLTTQWQSPEVLSREQWRGLRRLLEHAYNHVPYYRDVFHSLGAAPNDVQNAADLARFPLLTKEIIQTEGDALQARDGYNPGLVYVNHTGGSTGTPLTFVQDSNYRAWGMAELDRDFWMCGYRPGWRQAFLWGSDVDSRAHKNVRGRLHDLILNLRWIDTFDLDLDRLREGLQELVVFRPRLIVGYVSSLTLLAQLIEGEGRPGPTPQAVQTSAEVLTLSARRLIERALGAPCFDRYGCREVGNIAHECEAHAGLHLLIESNYTEFIRDDGTTAGPGTAGQIVVTNLRNYAMPFIRYATGDMGVPTAKTCPCGRGLPLMEGLQGRISDVITTPSGRLLHGEFFTHLFYGMTGIQQFQVEQMTLVDLVVRMVASTEEAYDAARVKIADLITKHGDPRFRVAVERAPRIAPRKSGKYCFTFSHVPVSFEREARNAVAR